MNSQPLARTFTLLFFIFSASLAYSQNIGIGTTNPEAKLHVSGDFRLKNGVAVTTISNDSTFTQANDTTLPTQLAVRKFLQKGSWIAPAASSDSLLVFQSSIGEVGFNPISLFAKDGFTYVLSNDLQSIQLFDCRNPDTMVLRSSITDPNLFGCVALKVQGNYAYVITGSGSRLLIYDVSDPDHLVAKGSTTSGLANPSNLFVKFPYAYVTSEYNNRLCIFNVSDPNNIVSAGYTTAGLASPNDVCVNGNYAYVLSSLSATLSVFNITDPANPVYLSAFNLNLINPYRLFIQGNYAYILSVPGYESGILSIYDISNPLSVQAKGSTAAGLMLPTSIYVKGKYAFVVNNSYNGTHKLSTFDVSNPSLPLYIRKNTENYSQAYAVHMGGDELYVASTSNRLLSRFRLTTDQNGLTIQAGGNLAQTENIWKKGIGQGVIFSNATNIGITGVGTLELGYGVNKEINAGKIGYNVFTGDALDIVGAGFLSTTRKIKFWNEGGAEFAGNVSVGTTIGAEKLLVDGAVKVTASLTAGSVRATGRLIADDSLQVKAIVQEVIQAPVLQNGWVNHGGGFADAGFWKDKEGVVHLQGLIKNGNTAQSITLFTLPPGYRPASRLIFTVLNNNLAGRIDILPGGEVIIANISSNLWLNFSGVHFRVN